MNKQMQIIREVNIEAEAFYEESVKLGMHAANVLTKGHRSQMTGLENIADTALKTADIFDYIKRQTARFTDWQQGDQKSGQPDTPFGLRLKKALEDLKGRRDDLCNTQCLNIGDETPSNRHLRQQVYLLLIRQFIHQMVVHYEFHLNFPNGAEGSKSRNAHA
jgi:hypothetical protein